MIIVSTCIHASVLHARALIMYDDRHGASYVEPDYTKQRVFDRLNVINNLISPQPYCYCVSMRL